MTIFTAILIGGLFAAGFYCLLRRSIVRLIIGLILISHAINLLILTAGGLTRGKPPIIEVSGITPATVMADPLPQAFILTAIVIGFGVLAFSMVLVYRAYELEGTDDLDKFRDTDA